MSQAISPADFGGHSAHGGIDLHDPIHQAYQLLHVGFTVAQWARLEAAFATGVCDFSKPSVGQVAPKPWQTFADGPGGHPLGDPPVSKP